MEYIQHGAFLVTRFPSENPYRFLMVYRKKIWVAFNSSEQACAVGGKNKHSFGMVFF